MEGYSVAEGCSVVVWHIFPDFLGEFALLLPLVLELGSPLIGKGL